MYIGRTTRNGQERRVFEVQKRGVNVLQGKGTYLRALAIPFSSSAFYSSGQRIGRLARLQAAGVINTLKRAPMPPGSDVQGA